MEFDALIRSRICQFMTAISLANCRLISKKWLKSVNHFVESKMKQTIGIMKMYALFNYAIIRCSTCMIQIDWRTPFRSTYMVKCDKCCGTWIKV